jgi:radical SAM protein with 4Fe4S-binding SPASM domain
MNARPFGMMAFEDFASVVDGIGRWLYKIRFYSWGEPLLHKDIYRMISLARQRNIGTELSTSFNPIEHDDVDELVDSGLEHLIISLDGASERTYGTYRVGGDFGRVMRNIHALMEAKTRKKGWGPLVEIQFLVMKHNEHEIQAMKKLAKESGVDRLRLAPISLNVKDPDQVKAWLPADERWSRYEYRRLTDKIYIKRRRCEWLWRSAVVNWDGTISPCCVFEGPKADFGSLKDGPFEEIWNNAHYRSARGAFSKADGIAGPSKNICVRCRGIPRAADQKQYGLY